MQLYTATSGFDWYIQQNENATVLPKDESIKFEEIAGPFFFEEINNASIFDQFNVKVAVVQVNNQAVQLTDKKLLIGSDITIIYSSNKIDQINEFSSKLKQVFNKEKLGSLLDLLKDGNVFNSESSISGISFPVKENGSSVLPNPVETEEDKNAKINKIITIVAIVLMVLLLIASVTLVWISTQKKSTGCCCRRKRNRHDKNEIKPSLTIETINSGDDSPKGILGAKKTYSDEENKDVSMTPKRPMYQEDYECTTPMSINSEITDTTHYSDTSRAPLGIVSMNKLDSMLANIPGEFKRQSPTNEILYQMNSP